MRLVMGRLVIIINLVIGDGWIGDEWLMMIGRLHSSLNSMHGRIVYLPSLRIYTR